MSQQDEGTPVADETTMQAPMEDPPDTTVWAPEEVKASRPWEETRSGDGD